MLMMNCQCYMSVFFLYMNRTFEYYCTIFLSVILKNSYLNHIISVLIFTYF